MPGPGITHWKALLGAPARRAVALTLPLLVLACHAATPTTTTTRAVKTTPTSPAASAVTGPEERGPLDTNASAPPATTSAAPTALPSTVTSQLLPPAGTSQVLGGHVLLDAASLGSKSAVSLAVGGQAVAAPPGGSILSNNGSSLVVGGNVVSLASGNAIPTAGSGVDATVGGAAFVTADGRLLPSGGLISDNGGAIIANNSGGLIANNSAGLVANNSAGVISNNAGGFRLLDVAVPGPTALPVAGALVSAVSLKTHLYIPVGVDANQKPIYSIFTDLTGSYKLYLPASEVGNVLVAVGAAPKAGTGVQYNAIVTPNAQTTTTTDVNEDDDIATQAIRSAFVDDMTNILTSANATATLAGGSTSLGTLQVPVAQFVALINTRAQKDGIPQGPDARRIPAVHALAAALCDAIIGSVDQSQLQLSSLFAPAWTGPTESVQSALAATNKALRVQTAAYLGAHPAPTTVTYVLDERGASDAAQPLCPEHVLVPLTSDTDLVTYAIGLMLTNTAVHPTVNMSRAFAAVAIPAIPLAALDGDAQTTTGPLSLPSNPDVYTDAASGKVLHYSSRVTAALQTVTGSILLSIADPSSPLSGVLLATIDAFVAAHSLTATPAPVPTPSFQVIPCAGPVAVDGATAATAATGATQAGS